MIFGGCPCPTCEADRIATLARLTLALAALFAAFLLTCCGSSQAEFGNPARDPCAKTGPEVCTTNHETGELECRQGGRSL